MLLPYEILGKIYIICAFNTPEFSFLQQTIIYNIRVLCYFLFCLPQQNTTIIANTMTTDRLVFLTAHVTKKLWCRTSQKEGVAPKKKTWIRNGVHVLSVSQRNVLQTKPGNPTPHHSHIITLSLLWSGCVKSFLKKNGRRMHWYFSIVKHKVTPNLILNDSDFLQAKFFFNLQLLERKCR